MRRELKEAKAELHAFSTQLSRAQGLIAKYQQTIVNLQAAQSEREANQAEQVRYALDERVSDVEQSLRSEMEEQMQQRLQAAEREMTTRLSALRKGEAAADRELREALEESRHALQMMRREAQAAEAKRQDEARAHQQLNEQQQAALDAQKSRLEEKDAQLTKLKAALDGAASDAGSLPSVPHRGSLTWSSAGAASSSGSHAQRQLFGGEQAGSAPSNATPSTHSAWVAAQLQAIEAEMNDLHSEIDRTADHLETHVSL